ncbi:hypothetical protein RhiirA1_508465 [Rhizophagus irregularis]|uniref:Ion transport domain-containing protein n=1 Tax=Rhizophagus irregularis TaxID=588596 RepID=A0A2N0RX39_9GLOM|nr:hypothetical protein RhiirA1_508465 [Rhizophagus irregularis]
MFEYRPNDGKMRDFYLKVYWYEKVSKEFEIGVDEITKQENEIVAEDEERKEKIIRRHECEEMVVYINRIIWRFIKYRPDDFKLLDIRHNVMKNLILDDCDHLIKFILFGNDDDGKKANKLHIPRNIFWKKKKYVDDDTESEKITNIMELAIYHCKDFVTPLNTKYILLTESKKTKDSFNGTTTNPLNGQELNGKMKANFDSTDRNDNPFSYYPTAMVATYFWLNGDFVQRDSFDFWAVEVFSLIASILLVTILQNMLIAFMGGVYEEAATKGRQALFRANQIANYEAFYHLNFPPIEHDPKYIYYIGQSKNFETWRENRKDDGAIYKGFEEKSTFTKFVFEEKDYDKFSIWVIEIEINNKKKMKKDLNDNIDNLLNKLNDQKRDDNAEKIDKKIEEIENINNVSGIIELLIKKT